LAAETAWLQAQSDRIDAEIDSMLTASALQKALGILNAQ
jgi:putative outer membrane efflux protein